MENLAVRMQQLSLVDNLLIFRNIKFKKNLDVNINASLLIVDTGIPSDTKSAVDFLYKVMGTATDDTTRFLNQLGNNTEKFFQLLPKGALDELGNLMNSSHLILKKNWIEPSNLR